MCSRWFISTVWTQTRLQRSCMFVVEPAPSSSVSLPEPFLVRLGGGAWALRPSGCGSCMSGRAWLPSQELPPPHSGSPQACQECWLCTNDPGVCLLCVPQGLVPLWLYHRWGWETLMSVALEASSSTAVVGVACPHSRPVIPSSDVRTDGKLKRSSFPLSRKMRLEAPVPAGPPSPTRTGRAVGVEAAASWKK